MWRCTYACTPPLIITMQSGLSTLPSAERTDTNRRQDNLTHEQQRIMQRLRRISSALSFLLLALILLSQLSLHVSSSSSSSSSSTSPSPTAPRLLRAQLSTHTVHIDYTDPDASRPSSVSWQSQSSWKGSEWEVALITLDFDQPMFVELRHDDKKNVAGKSPTVNGSAPMDGEHRTRTSLLDLSYFLSLHPSHRSILAGLARFVCASGFILESFPVDPSLSRKYIQQQEELAKMDPASFRPEPEVTGGHGPTRSLEEMLQALLPTSATTLLKGATKDATLSQPLAQPNQLFPLAGAGVSEFAWQQALGTDHSFRSEHSGYDSYNQLSYLFLLRSTHHPQATAEISLPARVDTWLDPRELDQCDLYVVGRKDPVLEPLFGRPPRLVNGLDEEFRGFCNVTVVRHGSGSNSGENGSKKDEQHNQKGGMHGRGRTGTGIPPESIHYHVTQPRNSLSSFLAEDMSIGAGIPFLSVLLGPAIDWFLPMFQIQLSDFLTNALGTKLMSAIMSDGAGDSAAGADSGDALGPLGKLLDMVMIQKYTPTMRNVSEAQQGPKPDLFSAEGLVELEGKMKQLDEMMGTKHAKLDPQLLEATATAATKNRLNGSASSADDAAPAPPRIRHHPRYLPPGGGAAGDRAHGYVRFSREEVHLERDWAAQHGAHLHPSRRHHHRPRGSGDAASSTSSSRDSIGMGPHALSHRSKTIRSSVPSRTLINVYLNSDPGDTILDGHETETELENIPKWDHGRRHMAREAISFIQLTHQIKNRIRTRSQGKDQSQTKGKGKGKGKLKQLPDPSGSIAKPLADQLVKLLTPKVSKSLAESLHAELKPRVHDVLMDGLKDWESEQLTTSISRDVAAAVTSAVASGVPPIVDQEVSPLLTQLLRPSIHHTLTRSLGHGVGLTLSYTLRDVGRQEPVCYYCEFVNASYCKLCYRSRHHKYQKYEDMYSMDYWIGMYSDTWTQRIAEAATP